MYKPDDIIVQELLLLEIEDIVKLRTASKQYKRIIDSNFLWCQLLKRDYGILETNNCKEIYKKEYAWWKKYGPYYRKGELILWDIVDKINKKFDIYEDIQDNIEKYWKKLINKLNKKDRELLRDAYINAKDLIRDILTPYRYKIYYMIEKIDILEDEFNLIVEQDIINDFNLDRYLFLE